MRHRGGYNVPLQGKPSREVHVLPPPETLYLPLRSRRLRFSQVCVGEGQEVRPGEVLARDVGDHGVPLLAPRAGTVRLGAVARHIVLENVVEAEEEPFDPREEAEHIPKGMGATGIKRYKLLELGAWQFFCDAHSGQVPNPFGIPQAVIVSTIRLEPFLARGDVQMRKRLSSFTRGLEQLQGLLEYQPIHLVVPDVKSEFAAKVRETLRGYAWVKMTQVPLRYGLDGFHVLARALGLKRDPDRPVWGLTAEGVLAVDRALTLSRPSTVRIVAVGGPGAGKAVHVKAMAGYPVQKILEACEVGERVRVVAGGALTGEAWPPEQMGLDTECAGLTILPDEVPRKLLGWARLGWKEQSYAPYYLSHLRKPFVERLTTGVRGERRACVSCQLCEEVCPAGIWPHLIHKYLYQDKLEQAEAARLDLCTECGLCAYVCPSKLELLQQFQKAKADIQAELAEEAEDLEEAAAGKEVGQ
ncbi:MAG TPA: 4Fe-4S dicluster domain-containing protein [Phycisphaerae bacterium]|nr:4Fe-4S dicluster domain-containing protein [Phycisphaerae bacterium]